MTAHAPIIRRDRRRERPRDKHGRYVTKAGKNVRWGCFISGCHPSLATMPKPELVAVLLKWTGDVAMQKQLLGESEPAAQAASKADAMRREQHIKLQNRVSALKALVLEANMRRQAIAPKDYEQLAQEVADRTGAPFFASSLYRIPYREIVRGLPATDDAEAAKLRAFMRLTREELFACIATAKQEFTVGEARIKAMALNLPITPWNSPTETVVQNLGYEWPIRKS